MNYLEKNKYEYIEAIKSFQKKYQIEKLDEGITYLGLNLTAFRNYYRAKYKSASILEQKEILADFCDVNDYFFTYKRDANEEILIVKTLEFLKTSEISELKNTLVYDNCKIGAFRKRLLKKFNDADFSNKRKIRKRYASFPKAYFATNRKQLKRDTSLLSASIEDYIIATKEYIEDKSLKSIKRTTVFKGLRIGKFMYSQRQKFKKSNKEEKNKLKNIFQELPAEYLHKQQ